ncbi:ribonuclease III [Mesorhizobium microcysteis]|jgi:ribonuclease-3|uniref:Ribonuclease 3 n=1 Tax=Neoaquamicrobium microcysteis TaxID=2682781 RepID=A0A5D4GWL8_9HYPH|nr:ribonuclease III [Mesorhizobium microcysteis]TYR32768.1 ribonuclease III [Mesorhizobium microcysteis]
MAAKPRNGPELVAAIEAITGHAFADVGLLRRALTHASAKGAQGSDYQRLEFLGDRVLGLVVAQMVFEAHPRAPEGELSLRLNALVNAETLAEIADELGLSDLILAGSELRTLTGRKRVNLRADVMEAVIAAVYLEGGLETARSFIRRHWDGRSKAPTAARRDAKTELQEWAHQVAKASPLYVIDKREGPDHDPIFEVSVRIAGLAPATGCGRSKREAEQAAAAAILAREGVWHEEAGA